MKSAALQDSNCLPQVEMEIGKSALGHQLGCVIHLVTWRGIGLARPTRSGRDCVPQLGLIPCVAVAKNNAPRLGCVVHLVTRRGIGLDCGLGQGAGKTSTGCFSDTHPFDSPFDSYKKKENIRVNSDVSFLVTRGGIEPPSSP